MVLPIVNLRVKIRGGQGEQIRATNEAVVAEVTRDGQRWISTTFVNGKSVIRMMVISYLTGERRLEGSKKALMDAAKKVNRLTGERDGRSPSP